MTIATYTVTETAATSVARQIKIGVRAKSGSSIPSKAADWKGGAFPVMTFDLAAGATSATATIETAGNTVVDGNREFEFYEVSRSPSGGTLAMNPAFATITDDDQVQPIVISNWLYSDDLEDAATDSDPLIRANWTAAGPNQDRYRVSSFAGGKAVYNNNIYRANGDLLFGPDLNSDATDIGFEIEVDENRSGNAGATNGAGYNVDSQTFLLFYRDASNFLTFNSGTDGISPRILRVSNGGTESFIGNNIRHSLQVAPPTAPAGTASNKFTLQYHKGRLRYRFPFGEWALRADTNGFPYDSPDISKITGLTDIANRRGRFGIRNSTWTYPLLNGVRIKPLKMVITSHARYCSRTTFTSGVGRIWIKGDYYGTMTRVAYRVWSMPAPKTLVQDTKDITDAVFNNDGTFSVLAQIPQGGPYEIELIMTDSEGKTYNTWTKRVSCGEFYITNGQSNSVNRGYPLSAAVTAFNPKCPSQKYLGANPDKVPDYELAGLGTVEFPLACNLEMARTISDGTGLPCLVLSTGVSGSGIGGVMDDTNFANTFTKTRNLIDGVVDGVLWDQGEGDRDGVYSPDTYAAQLEAGLAKMADATGNPNLPMWISPIGRFASSTPPNNLTTWTNVDKYARVIKLAYEALMVKLPTRVRYADHKLGQFHGTNTGATDAYHYTSAGYEEMSRRAGRTVLKDRGYNVPDGRGPTPTGVTRASAVLTLAVNLNGATALTDLVTKSTAPDDAKGVPALSGALYGYEVSSDDFVTLLTISSITRSGSSLVITLAADPGKAVKIRSYHGGSYDDRQMFWGTGYAGGREDVPIAPILNYLTSN